MAINVVHSPGAAAIGGGALLGGQGQFAKERDQFFESNRRFDDQMGLQRDQFAEQQHQFDQNLGLQQAQLQQRENLAMLNVYENRQQREAQLFSQAMAQQARMQYLGMQGAMQQDALGQRHAEAVMQQQAMGQRQQTQIEAQMQMQQNAHVAQQMQADWAAIQKELPYLDDEARASLEGQFLQRYGSSGLPMPISPPPVDQMPAELDPIKKLQLLQGSYPDVPWVLDDKGNPQVPRGFNPQLSPQYQDSEHTRQLELIEKQNAVRRDEMEWETQFKEEESRIRAGEMQAKAEAAAQQARMKMQLEILEARMEIQRKAREAFSTTDLGTGEKTLPESNKQAMQAFIEEQESLLRQAFPEFMGGGSAPPQQQQRGPAPPEVEQEANRLAEGKPSGSVVEFVKDGIKYTFRVP